VPALQPANSQPTSASQTRCQSDADQTFHSPRRAQCAHEHRHLRPRPAAPPGHQRPALTSYPTADRFHERHTDAHYAQALAARAALARLNAAPPLAIYVHMAFELAPDAECGIEVDPRTASPERLQHLAALGFNRIRRFSKVI
jgi:hypothetical protein